ncbi:MAG: hypothetical protein ACE5H8_05720 [Alphaproteobacteria bacterium]
MLAASHVVLRVPLHLPGHWGVVDMAILITARRTVRHPWAATLTSAAAAGVAFLPTMGFGHAAGLMYLLSGFVIDLGYRRVPCWRHSVLFLAVLAALGHGAKHLARWLIATVSDASFGSLSQGLAYPFFSHLLFGLAGGLAAVLVWRVLKGPSDRPDHSLRQSNTSIVGRQAVRYDRKGRT